MSCNSTWRWETYIFLPYFSTSRSTYDSIKVFYFLLFLLYPYSFPQLRYSGANIVFVPRRHCLQISVLKKNSERATRSGRLYFLSVLTELQEENSTKMRIQNITETEIQFSWKWRTCYWHLKEKKNTNNQVWLKTNTFK